MSDSYDRDSDEEESLKFTAPIWRNYESESEMGSSTEQPRSNGSESSWKPKITTKKVSFKDDDVLVQVIEIPRYETPLSEELKPCDPEKLAENLSEIQISEKVSTSGKQSPVNQNPSDLRTTSNKNLEVISKLTGLSSYGLNSSAITNKTVQALTDSLNSTSQRARTTKQLEKPLRVKEATSSSKKHNRGRGSGKGNKHRRKSPGGGEKHERKKPGSAPPSTYNFRETLKTKSLLQGTSLSPDKTTKRATKQSIGLATKGLNVGSQLLIAGEGLPAQPRVHHISPYRQGSASGISAVRSIRLSTPAETAISSGGMKFSSSTLRHAASATDISDLKPLVKVSPRKVYAWQLANGSIDNQQPAIAQMWEMQTR